MATSAASIIRSPPQRLLPRFLQFAQFRPDQPLAARTGDPQSRLGDRGADLRQRQTREARLERRGVIRLHLDQEPRRRFAEQPDLVGSGRAGSFVDVGADRRRRRPSPPRRPPGRPRSGRGRRRTSPPRSPRAPPRRSCGASARSDLRDRPARLARDEVIVRAAQFVLRVRRRGRGRCPAPSGPSSRSCRTSGTWPSALMSSVGGMAMSLARPA